MKRVWVLFVSVLMLFSYCLAQGEKSEKTKADSKAKTAKAESTEEGETDNAVGRVLATSMTHVRRMFLPLADAMPDDKYNFVPTNGEFKGVRSFGEQLKHVAATNYYYGSLILGEKPPADTGENGNGPASLKGKREIIEYLGNSFDYVKKAVATIDEKNMVAPIKNPFGQGSATRLAVSNLIIEHSFDHYGQMIEYLRMNGIVPPASQR